MEAAREKTALRESMLAKRRALPRESALALSPAAQEHILADSAWRRAGSVALYLAVRNEADTGVLLEAAQNQGKVVFLPYTQFESPGVMLFLPWKKGQTLAKSRFGIPEPLPDVLPAQGKEHPAPDLVVVPGVAFDAKGRRVGFGAGYYDRLFAKPFMRKSVRMALAYGFQVVETAPAEAWDLPMHAVATEKGVVWL